VKLFDVSKVGCFCDGVSHALEKRRGEDVKVLTLTLRVAPFDSKLATAMPDGVKPTLFKLNNGEPKGHAAPRRLRARRRAPDPARLRGAGRRKATRALDQVRIHGTYARSQKDRNGFDLRLQGDVRTRRSRRTRIRAGLAAHAEVRHVRSGRAGHVRRQRRG
jgi:hypothetical protein